MITEIVDIVVIGGGINGTAIAADAAGRGLKVLLCEQADLGSGTSSRSTKLIHGGLRYLEHYEIKLVREALREREILLHRAPHLVKPLQFILPHENHLRPAWMIQAGLFLYDHLAKRRLIPRSKRIKLQQHPAGEPLANPGTVGFSYFDAQTDDCRLVIANAQSAFGHGAMILTHTRCIQARRGSVYWNVDLEDQFSGSQQTVCAKVVINATGPWLNQTLEDIVENQQDARVTLIKGSHVVVKSLYDGDHAYLLQTQDQRIIFTIPYQQQFTLIGTTDIRIDHDPADAKINDQERQYLIGLINHYFTHNLTPNDIVWEFSGVRALYSPQQQTAAKISRDYHIDIEEQHNLPLINIFGGKITTHRHLAEDAINRLRPYFPRLKPPWTATQALPGGEFNHRSLDALHQQYQQQYPWLDKDCLTHYLNHYGSALTELVGSAKNMEDLGLHCGGTLYAIEIDYLMAAEWAVTAEDILWRRTKYGLHLTPQSIEIVKDYLNETH